MNLCNRVGIARQIQLNSHNYLGRGGWPSGANPAWNLNGLLALGLNLKAMAETKLPITAKQIDILSNNKDNILKMYILFRNQYSNVSDDKYESKTFDLLAYNRF